MPLTWLRVGIIVIASCLLCPKAIWSQDSAATKDRPNILWLTCEDIGPHLGCYGSVDADTPNLDRLAARGMKFARAWSTAPVCAPAKTAIITGMYSTSLGAHHMRSEIACPEPIRLLPELMKSAGYYCAKDGSADYNVQWDPNMWKALPRNGRWESLDGRRPFFAMIVDKQTHEGKISATREPLSRDPAKVHIPSYHPDRPEVRRDWARYHQNITNMDRLVGRRLSDLEEAGLADDTIVFFFGDHGSGMPRNKRFACNAGLQVPMIVYVPDKWRHLAPKGYTPGSTSPRLVSFIDLAPTLLSIAGVQPPVWMQGTAFMGEYQTKPPEYLFGLRGRMDERYDLVRAVTDGRYVYVRNYMPHLPHGQHVRTMFRTPTTRVWKSLFDAGQLSNAQAAFWQRKASEELYDLEVDSDEVNNLADSEAHRATLERLRSVLRAHLLKTRDIGFLPEGEMHHRAAQAGKTIFEIAQDPQFYPIERILEAAELASRNESDEKPFLKLCRDAEAGVRYWGMIGLLGRGEPTSSASRDLIVAGLDDSCPDVRVVAAEVLGQFGGPSDVDRSLKELAELADPQRHGLYVAVAALNVIDRLGPKAAPLADKLRSIDPIVATMPKRVNDYARRLVDKLLNDFSGAGDG